MKLYLAFRPGDAAHQLLGYVGRLLLIDLSQASPSPLRAALADSPDITIVREMDITEIDPDEEIWRSESERIVACCFFGDDREALCGVTARQLSAWAKRIGVFLVAGAILSGDERPTLSPEESGHLDTVLFVDRAEHVVHLCRLLTPVEPLIGYDLRDVIDTMRGLQGEIAVIGRTERDLDRFLRGLSGGDDENLLRGFVLNFSHSPKVVLTLPEIGDRICQLEAWLGDRPAHLLYTWNMAVREDDVARVVVFVLRPMAQTP